ncbi:MAG: hypothetical protein S4CHLAM37_10730 [Chlamydiia bacterium]|nr:hypothetical protein [Chlamydiia bacterium]
MFPVAACCFADAVRSIADLEKDGETEMFETVVGRFLTAPYAHEPALIVLLGMLVTALYAVVPAFLTACGIPTIIILQCM